MLAIDENGAPLTLPLPLQEANGSFAKSFDGPPTDPKVFEDNYKKLGGRTADAHR